MELLKIPNNASHLKILNIVLKVFYLWYAMIKANAHIYVHTGGAAISLFCRLSRKKFICEIASDAVVNRGIITKKIREFNRSKFSIDALVVWLDIKLADAIVVQSRYQKEMLKRNFNRDSFLIKMPYPLTEREMPKKKKPPIVLWVGSMAEVKQPELFLRLAEIMPEVKFQMIGGYSRNNQELYDKVRKNSKRIPNLEFLGCVPFNEVGEYFRQASILVNTSMFEGFPHAFIQAWMNYVPVVSLNADPDNIIQNEKMGFRSGTFKQLISDINTLLSDEKLRKTMGENARKYVEREHDVKKVVKMYIKIFNQLACGEHVQGRS
jgi:glycosyltransferase involved in cell wall biosynthesis